METPPALNKVVQLLDKRLRDKTYYGRIIFQIINGKIAGVWDERSLHISEFRDKNTDTRDGG